MIGINIMTRKIIKKSFYNMNIGDTFFHAIDRKIIFMKIGVNTYNRYNSENKNPIVYTGFGNHKFEIYLSKHKGLNRYKYHD